MDLSRWFLQTNEFFFFFFFLIIDRKPKNIQANSEAWILVKLQCVIHQWIRLDELYNLIESFIQISESFFKLTNFFEIIVELGLCMRGGGGICADQHAF